jgi:uncharacterized protein with NRDE domain
MCTLALFFHELRGYPLVVGANRDEYFNRPTAPPCILLDHPLVFGGKDLWAGGTWLGVNEHGLLVGILNRRSEGEKEKSRERSRGLLCLDVLKAGSPAQACSLLRREKGSAYQPFNLFFADADEAFVAYNVGEHIEWVGLERGIHVLSNTSIYDPPSGRGGHARRLLPVGTGQERDNVRDHPSFIGRLKGILSSHGLCDEAAKSSEALCVHRSEYGTVSSSVIFYQGDEKQFHFYHASGPPCRSEYRKLGTVEAT